MSDIELVNSDIEDVLQGLEPESVDFVVADPPWAYSDGGGATRKGLAIKQYDCLDALEIARHIRLAHTVAKEHCYLALWCTFPKIGEWLYYGPFTTLWEYRTGGAWGKYDGKLGVGYHLRGDAELVLLYKKGKPQPLRRDVSNLWLAPRLGHSEKPQAALYDLVTMCCPEGGLVLDLYAGASASLMRACRATGRRYLGAEIDSGRYAEALRRYSLEEQAAMALEVA